MNFKNILTAAVVLGVAATAAQAHPLYMSGKRVMDVNPLHASVLSVENGGTLTAIDAYQDGVGLVIVSISISGKISVSNEPMNILVTKYGQTAKDNGVQLPDYVLSNPAATDKDVIFANLIKNGITEGIYPNGTACDDGDATTSDDAYLNGECIGTPAASNTCLGDRRGSITANGLLVVGNSDIKNYAKTTTAICTSNVTDMSGLYEVSNGTEFSNIEDWDTSNVTDMSNMFFRAYSFNKDLSAWNVTNVTNMNSMFNNASVFNQDLSAWNVANVTNSSSFDLYSALIPANLPSF